MRRLSLPILVVAGLAAAALVAGCGDDDGDDTSSATTTTATTTTADVDSELCSSLTKLQGEVEDVNSLSSSDISLQVITNEYDQITSTVDQLAAEAKQTAGDISDQVTSAVDKFKSSTGDISEQSVPEALVTLGSALGKLEGSLKDVSSEAGCS